MHRTTPGALHTLCDSALHFFPECSTHEFAMLIAIPSYGDHSCRSFRHLLYLLGWLSSHCSLLRFERLFANIAHLHLTSAFHAVLLNCLWKLCMRQLTFASANTGPESFRPSTTLAISTYAIWVPWLFLQHLSPETLFSFRLLARRADPLVAFGAAAADSICLPLILRKAAPA